MPIPDRELPETLDLIAKLVASVSDRLDKQGEALKELAGAQARTDPELVARVSSRAVHDTLLPTMTKLVDVMEDLTGRKAVLRARLRAVTAEEARASWWRRHVPFAVTLLGAYALVLVFGLAFPRAMAEHALTCRAIGGTWYGPDASLPASCTLWLPEEERAQGS